MIEQELEQKLTKKVDSANKIIKVSLWGIVGVILFTLVLIVIQLVTLQKTQENNLAAMRASAAENHRQTQQYVKCIADVLLKPVADRKEVDFSECGIQGTNDTRD